MDIKSLFSFKGRSNRKKYFLSQLILIILYSILYLYRPDNSYMLFVKTPIYLLIAIFIMSKTAQRLHDIDLPGILILVPMVLQILGTVIKTQIFPWLGSGFILYLMMKKGTIGPNKYGEDPLGTPSQTEEPIINSE